MSSLLVALRLARRDAARARGRSALVVAMIGLPVLGVTAVDVAYRTFELSPEQRVTRQMGQADAVLSDSGQQTVRQLPAYEGIQFDSISGDEPRRGPAPPAHSVLPAGTRTVVRSFAAGTPRVSVGAATTTVQVSALDLEDPLVRGIYARREGRAPLGTGEAVVSGGLARRLGLAIGDRFELATEDGTSTRTVVGTAEDADGLHARSVVVAPGTLRRTDAQRVLVDVPRPLTWDDVQRANAQGFLLETRGAVPGQPEIPAAYQEAFDAATLTAITLVVGMALLEVVLLAGPAFAVGAKRRSRELALLAATGAERSDVRRVVLGGGVVLGAVGGVLGVAGGVLLTRLSLGWMERVNGELAGPFEVRALDVLVIAGIGVLTAVLAAVIPARSAARQDVVAGLTGRRGVVRSLRRVPVLGVLAAAVGAMVALEGARRRDVTVILVGSAVAELGLVATTPFLVGQAGRLARFLPLGPRLALRDAARNRGRTAPAVSAILAAVAGSVAIATVVASFDERDRRGYTPAAPEGTTWVLLDGQRPAVTAQVVTAMRESLPDAQVSVVRALQPPSDGMRDTGWVDVESTACAQAAPVDGCPPAFGTVNTFSGVLVGDAALYAALTGVQGDELARVRRSLQAGGAVVPREAVRPDGTAVVRVHDPKAGLRVPPRLVRVRAVAVDAELTAAVLSPSVAARVGVAPVQMGVIASGVRPPTGAEEDRLRGALRRLDLDRVLFVERGYQSEYGLGLLALALGSALIVLGASGIATGLAAADGRADLGTFAAVGASPRTRRVLAAFQSATTAGLGTLLGAVAGLVPAVAILRAMTNTIGVVDGAPVRQTVLPITLPWANIGVTLLVVPLVAALAAALLTRSRLPMVRRMG